MNFYYATTLLLLTHQGTGFAPLNTYHSKNTKQLLPSAREKGQLNLLQNLDFGILKSSKIYSTAVPSDELKQEVDINVEEPKHLFLNEAIPYSELTIGVAKETFDGECRVSQSPDSVKKLVNAGFDVVVQAGGT